MQREAEDLLAENNELLQGTPRKETVISVIDIKCIALNNDSVKYAEQKLKISLLVFYFHISLEKTELYG